MAPESLGDSTLNYRTFKNQYPHADNLLLQTVYLGKFRHEIMEDRLRFSIIFRDPPKVMDLEMVKICYKIMVKHRN